MRTAAADESRIRATRSRSTFSKRCPTSSRRPSTAWSALSSGDRTGCSGAGIQQPANTGLCRGRTSGHRGERLECRQYGRSGLRVSALSLGAMTFGEAQGFMKGVHSDDAEARRVFDAALAAGLDTVDTANGYSEGRSEELLGEWMKGRRHAVTLATKCRFPTLGGTAPMHPNESGLSRQSIIWNCEQSLRRLQTDYVHLYQVHMQDGSVPIEETLRALDDLQRAGKVRYLGCSNYTGYRLVESLWAADQRGTSRYEGVQLQWSLTARESERELVPAARAFGLGLMVWSPLGRGFLSGKYRKGEPPPAGS